jgi:hypothetical protein
MPSPPGVRRADDLVLLSAAGGLRVTEILEP